MSIFVKKYNIFYIHVKELKFLSLSVPIENSLWHARIGIFNVDRAYIKKVKVPRLSVTNVMLVYCSFRFFFIIKLLFRLKLPKLAFNSLYSSHVLF